MTSRTYHVITYGCQMNVHDSERIAGLLEEAGLMRAPEPAEPVLGAGADVVVFNTCAVRENADNRLYGNLGHMAAIKARHPGMQIAVGGCMAQKDRDVILRKAPWVDVVFGTHNVGSLPTLLERARVEKAAQVEVVEALQTFPSNLPSRRESPYSAWVSVSVGCNNTCTFCIVPQLRGKETDRRPGDILAEVRMLVDQGVQEITLLGQNVNAYGVEFGDRRAFAKLLRACGQVEGLERVRFTSPRKRFLGILERVREAMPHAAITTDIIVGFPGETDEDFEATMDVVREARFSAAYTFQYSKRPGTPAADMKNQVAPEAVRERYERLAELVGKIAWEENRRFEGEEIEVMFALGEGRKDSATNRMSGRARDNRLVHVAVGEEPTERPRPGDIAYATITHAAPHHLNSDAPLRGLRRTRGGDAWEAANTEVPETTGVSLGMPGLRRP